MGDLVIGTRGSALALWQAKHVRAALLARQSDLKVRLEVIRTKGDKALRDPLDTLGGKGLFTKEIEQALVDGSVDLAVHSLKDLPTSLPDGLAIAAVTTREDPADVLVSKDGRRLEQLSRGEKVLTGSLRRKAQLLHFRGDLEVLPVRGNVETRLRKLDESDAQAIVLARAGLVRLGLASRITERLDPAEFLPACGQGALALETRPDDARTTGIAASLNDPETHRAVAAERAFLAGLGGGCQVPAGAYATAGGEAEARRLTITGMVARLDGSRLVRGTLATHAGGPGAAADLGRKLAEELLAEGGREILQEIAPFRSGQGDQGKNEQRTS